VLLLVLFVVVVFRKANAEFYDIFSASASGAAEKDEEKEAKDKSDDGKGDDDKGSDKNNDEADASEKDEEEEDNDDEPDDESDNDKGDDGKGDDDKSDDKGGDQSGDQSGNDKGSHQSDDKGGDHSGHEQGSDNSDDNKDSYQSGDDKGNDKNDDEQDFITVKRERGDPQPLHVVVDFGKNIINDVKAKSADITETSTHDINVWRNGKRCDGYRRIQEYARVSGEVFVLTACLRGGGKRGRGAGIAILLGYEVKPGDSPVVQQALMFRLPALEEYLNGLGDLRLEQNYAFMMSQKNCDRLSTSSLAASPTTLP
jgi:hypothetical protein